MSDDTTLPVLTGPATSPVAGGAPEKLVIFCHGYGANGQDLIGLAMAWREDMPSTAFYSPDAPEPSPGMPGGRQWWAIRSFSPEEQEQGVGRAAPIFDKFIDAVMLENGLTEADTAVVGFSQGTMVALYAGLRRQRQLAAIVGYSGAVAAPAVLAGTIKSRPPVLLVHGEIDHMIPPVAMTSSERFLRDNGVNVQTHLSKGVGHGIGPDGVALGKKFLIDHLG